MYISILLFSIGSNGKLILEQELKGVYLMGKEVRKNLSEAGQEVKIKLYLTSILNRSFEILIPKDLYSRFDAIPRFGSIGARSLPVTLRKEYQNT